MDPDQEFINNQDHFALIGDDLMPFDDFQDAQDEPMQPEYEQPQAVDQSTEEEDDDDVHITLSNTGVKSDPLQAENAVTTTLKAPKPAVVLTPAFTNPLLKPSDLDDVALTTNYPIFEYDIEKGEKPWKKPGADISDYFNYGFNEETWKIYCERQRKLRVETASMRRLMGDPNPVPNVEIPNIEKTDFHKEESMQQLGSSNQAQVPPMPFTLPPGMPLNLPPEMANSIATMVASQLGLPPSFLSQLPPLPSLLSAGINPQAIFPPFFPGMPMPFMPTDQAAPVPIEETIQNQTETDAKNSEISEPTEEEASNLQLKKSASPKPQPRSRTKPEANKQSRERSIDRDRRRTRSRRSKEKYMRDRRNR